MNDGFLHKYFLNNSHKRLNKWIHYFDIYERHLNRFQNTFPTMIEIGVSGGGSLAMWKEYFGHDSNIIGVDINPKCKIHESDGIEIFIGSQDDSNMIEEIFLKYPKVDIILDDGSHKMKHMISSFELIYHKLDSNGIYIVEDTHSSYQEGKTDGGLKRKGTFIEFVKEKLDEINAVHIKELPITEFTKSTNCIACYDSIVVFERRRQGKRQPMITQSM
jgi:hypothetical protein